MKYIAILCAACIVSAAGFGQSHAGDYTTHHRIYANEPGHYYGSGHAAGASGGKAAYQPQKTSNMRAGSTWQKPTTRAQQYTRNAPNFGKSASASRLEQTQKGASETRASRGSYSNRALDIRLINMPESQRKAQQKKPTRNQVVLPQVMAQPLRIEQTPERVY